jgi:alcohol dehydrogenase class IV
MNSEEWAMATKPLREAHFEFATSSRIVFGPGTLRDVGPLLAEMGSHALIVTGSTPERAAPLFKVLSVQGIEMTTFTVTAEPSTDVVRDGIATARETRCDMVVGFGGGSALDAGKAIAALLANGGDPLDYLEVIGKGRSITQPSAPFVAIPTTAGTGTEVTRNAVLSSARHRIKVSLRSPLMLPRLALVDPELTYSLPPDVTAHTGLDALTQLIEPFISRQANAITDGLCREGIRRASRSLRRAYDDGRDEDAREDMALASLLGGLALANAKLGAVHGLAGVIGGMFHAPHGAICGRLLPHVMDVNVRAARQRLAGSRVTERLDEIACILIGSEKATARYGVTWLQALCETLQVPPLASYGVTERDFPTLVERASASSSMKGNPVDLTDSEMREILIRAL